MTLVRRCVWLWLSMSLAHVVPAVAHTCGTTNPCAAPGTTCTVTCSESDLRAALAVVNTCGGYRTITFDLGMCNGAPCTNCTITVTNGSSIATCGDLANAMCLTGDYITLNGANSLGQPGVVFHYGGNIPCASCRGECAGPQVGLFSVRGSHDVLQNFQLEFFPEGIHISAGDSNTVAGILDPYYCEDALTIDGGTRHAVANGVFSGASDPEAAQAAGRCYKERSTATGASIPCTTDTDCQGVCSGSGANCSVAGDCPAGESCVQPTGEQCDCPNGLFASDAVNGGHCSAAGSGTCYRKALCGLDKAIQINAGTGLSVVVSTFVNSLTPIQVSDGLGPADANAEGNSFTGSQIDLALSTDPTFIVKKEAACDGPAASGATATATFSRNTVQYCRFGIRSRAGATVHGTLNTVMHDYVSGFEIEGPSRLTGSLNRLKDNGTLPTTPSDPARGSLLVADDVGATVDFGSRLAGGEAGLNVFCGEHGDIWDKVAPCTAQCCGANVLAARNCYESGTHVVDPYGLVDYSDHGLVGLDAPCIDYGLTCNF